MFKFIYIALVFIFQVVLFYIMFTLIARTVSMITARIYRLFLKVEKAFS